MSSEKSLQPDGEKEKTLSRRFGRLRLDENDLLNLATLMQELANWYGGGVTITLKGGDDKDTFSSADPTVFLAPQLSGDVDHINLAYLHDNSPVTCYVSLPSTGSSAAVLDVSGTDENAVREVYHMLDRELVARSTTDVGRIRILTGWSGYLLFAALTGLAIFSLFDFISQWRANSVIGFAGSEQQDILRKIAMFASLYGAWLIGALAGMKMEEAFPPVEFSGKIGSTWRSKREHILLFLLLAFSLVAINLISRAALQ